MKKLFTLLALSVVLVPFSNAQTEFPPISISQGTYLGETGPLRDAPIIEEVTDIKNVRIIEQNFRVQGRASLDGSPNGFDPAVQTEPTFREPLNLLQNFVGATINEGQAIPPDPSGAVGPNHYVHAVNVVVKIFDKTGTLLAGPTSLGAFLGGGPSNGDPIVMYDQMADRYFVSQFRISTDALIIGVSTTPDPTGTYHLYNFPLDSFPDYPHYSVWPDAYFLTANKSGQATYALERDVMLVGGANPEIVGFNLPGVIANPATVFSPEPANLLGTTFPANVPGYIVYLQDDAWGGVSEDHLKIWEINLDFGGASTISAPDIIPTQDFDSFFRPFGSGDFVQPNTSQRIDGISGVVSYMVNYRSFPTHNSMLVNFNSDLGAFTSGVRWIELRNTGVGSWSIFQEGTWTIPDGVSRFMGSMAMDEDGNIGLAYNVVGPNLNPGIRYTGRLDGDPLGMMTFPESSIIEGGGVQTNTNRFGDYAQVTFDPDGRTFWSTAEYFATNNSWRTRIAAFRLTSDFSNDVGAYNFVSPGLVGPYTSAETVEVSLYNYGNSAQSNFDVELSLDGSVVATETYTGTLAPNSSDTFTFAQTVDLSGAGQTYVLEARTDLSGDELPSNDSVSQEFEGDVLSTNDFGFDERGLLVYPVGDKVYEIFFSTSQDFDDISYTVYDVLGREVTTGDLLKQTNGYKTQVNLSQAANGVYLISLTNGTYKASKKILVK